MSYLKKYSNNNKLFLSQLPPPEMFSYVHPCGCENINYKINLNGQDQNYITSKLRWWWDPEKIVSVNYSCDKISLLKYNET